MYEPLYNYGQPQQSLHHYHDHSQHLQGHDLKPMSNRQCAHNDDFESTTISDIQSSGSAMPNTLPTIPLLSHQQHGPNFSSHLQLPEHSVLKLQDSLHFSNFGDNFHHLRDAESMQHSMQLTVRSEPSTLGQAFDGYQSMGSPHGIVASFPYSISSTSSICPSVDMGTLVHSPATSLPELPTTLPPLNSGILHTSSSDHSVLPQTRRLAFEDNLAVQQPPAKKHHSSPRVSRERAPWTPEEDNLLRLAVQLYGDKTEKWAKIAECVPGRTNKNCRKRWFHSLDPSLRKGAWTDEEDQLLREGVMKYPNQWSKIADMLEGRTDDQCAKRWRESLDPSIDRSDWTPEEDRRLMEKYEEFGSQWQRIAQFFEGRPGLHCRNRWRKLQRMMMMKKEKEAAALTALPSATQLASELGDDGLSHGQTTRLPSHHNAVSRQRSMPTLSDTSSHGSNGTGSSESPGARSHATMIPSSVGGAPEDSKHEQHSDLNPYGCDIPGCLVSFPQSSGLFYHMKSAHPNMDGYDKPFRCAMPNCAKRYKNINGLQYHLREAKGSSGHGALSAKMRKPFLQPPLSGSLVR